ncbi:glycosyltransferase family 4 protein [Vampirovibrio chlorellavorus]|uniref:glycosyltransferase family 4 protein n=1 Tax=Vampirovibrio chlorellavorus TaxID=758823 RepID=UPI0026E9C2CB|nr:glycosyltransferase family 4 protein [Vampirovibrio chlorellavorus]
MKLLFICHLTQHTLDDTVRAMRYLGRELAMRGHEVDYFFRRPQDSDEQPEPISLLEWPMRIAPLASRKCQQKQYDIVLATGSSGWCLSSFRDWLLPPETRVVSWYLHDDPAMGKPVEPLLEDLPDAAPDLTIPPIPKDCLLRQLNVWTVEQALKTQDGCFLTGLEDVHHIRRKYPQYASKAMYQPRGVDAKFYSPQRLKQKATPPSRLLLIGNNHPEKPIAQPVVEAFQQILKAHPQVTLTVAGDNQLPSPDELFADFPEPLKPALHSVRVQQEETLPDLYLQHDLFIQPHRTPAQPLAVLEAMASAMPAVVVQNPDFQEVVTHYESGLLVPPDNPQAMVESVTHLLGNPTLCQAMGEAAFETVTRCYTWHQVCDIFEVNLTRILEQAFA